jgi:PPOX class probable F420-dependent enzyme
VPERSPGRGVSGRVLCAVAARIRYDKVVRLETTPAPTDDPAELNVASCLLLETTKQNGEKVSTPVWYIVAYNTIWILTSERSRKVARARREPIVTVTPCTLRGRPKGEYHLVCRCFVVPRDGATGAEWAMQRTLGSVRNRVHRLAIRDPIYLALRPLTTEKGVPEDEALAAGVSAVREARLERARRRERTRGDGGDEFPAA